MKKFCVALVLCLGLSGCAAAETFETLGQVEHDRAEAPAMGKINLTLPQSAAAEVFANRQDRMYDCGSYTLMVQTLSAGDLARTVETICGYSPENLTIMESETGKNSRYEWVWTAAGEGGDVLCRAAVLDDGDYHYCLYAMASAEQAGQLQTEWTQVFASFSLSSL